MESEIESSENERLFNEKSSSLIKPNQTNTNSFKHKAFLVFHSLLKYESVSYLTVCTLCFIELMQLLSFCFNRIVRIIFNYDYNSYY